MRRNRYHPVFSKRSSWATHWPGESPGEQDHILNRHAIGRELTAVTEQVHADLIELLPRGDRGEPDVEIGIRSEDCLRHLRRPDAVVVRAILGGIDALSDCDAVEQELDSHRRLAVSRG